MKEDLSRRDFMNVAAVAALAAAFYPMREIVENYCFPEHGINPNAREILLNTPKLNFDAKGNLNYLSENNELLPVEVMPTDFNLKHSSERDLVKKISILIHHYDAGPRFGSDGLPRTAISTLWGLNSNFASTNFCIDEHPIGQKERYGILQTQKVSGCTKNQHYRGKQVYIGMYVESGRPDINRIKTLENFHKLGIASNLNDLADMTGDKMNYYSFSYEQVGTRFSRNFPDNFPPPRQIANVFGLCLAVSNQYGLGPWDNVGHHEIQEKPDPGDEFMALIRYLYGISAITGMIDKQLVFKNAPEEKYFSNLRDYFSKRAGMDAYNKWDEKYGLNLLIDDIKNSENNNSFRKNIYIR
jgi:hypothetical protein